MNKYGNKYGCHTPKETERLCNMLEAAGIPFEDNTWHNDACDQVLIYGGRGMIWVANPADGFDENAVVERDPIETTADRELATGSFEQLIEKAKEVFGGDSIEQLAKTFSFLLKEEITEKITLVNERNKDDDPYTCASHDFCDANMVMFEAFQKVMGREMDVLGEKDMELVGQAWDVAKAAKFYTGV